MKVHPQVRSLSHFASHRESEMLPWTNAGAYRDRACNVNKEPVRKIVMTTRPLRIKYRHWAFRLPLLRRYDGMVLGRTILCKHVEGEIPPALLRHELIHLEQIERYGVVQFYLIYLRDYLANLCRFRNHDTAYRNIPFEKEAYEREREQ